MAIKNYDYTAFMDKLHDVLTTSTPVSTPEKLFGRDNILNQIEDALYAPGRHVFIYGERGVGKTSLAHTAAYKIQSSDAKPICISCNKNSNFLNIIESIYFQATANIPSEKLKKITTNFSIGACGFALGFSHEKTIEGTTSITINLDNALFALKYISEYYSDKTVIVIDEFDLIKELEEREKFGVLLKNLSDQNITNLKIIFTGIGDSLHSLLGGHLSSARQLHQVKLDKLNWSGRKDIIDHAFINFNLNIDEEICYKICGLSDGFPYYVHLMTEHVLLKCYHADHIIEKISNDLFLKALDTAVESVAELLRRDYDKATYADNHMHYLLWAMANSGDAQRKYEQIYNSYKQIINALKKDNIKQLDFDKFKSKFSKLRKESYGSIITHALFDIKKEKPRPGWFKFKEEMVRGFIRMVAQNNGLMVTFEETFLSVSVGWSKSKRVYHENKYLTSIEQEVAISRGDPK